MIDIEKFFETELKVGTVTAAEAVPKSNKLVQLTVDLGGESRQVVAGIARQYPPEALVGRQVVVVANLQPATLMGVESQGHGAGRVGGRRAGAAPARSARAPRHPGQVTAPRGGGGAAGPWQQTEDRVGAPLSPLEGGRGVGGVRG